LTERAGEQPMSGGGLKGPPSRPPFNANGRVIYGENYSLRVIDVIGLWEDIEYFCVLRQSD
jgi:hypothetical protein